MYILPPVNATHHPAGANWDWNLPKVKKIRVLYKPSINKLHLKFSAKLPNGRNVTEIQGAMAYSHTTDVALEQTPSDPTHTCFDDDLDAFLRLTVSNPIRLLIILHKTNIRKKDLWIRISKSVNVDYTDYLNFTASTFG